MCGWMGVCVCVTKLFDEGYKSKVEGKMQKRLTRIVIQLGESYSLGNKRKLKGKEKKNVEKRKPRLGDGSYPLIFEKIRGRRQ